MLKPNPNKFQPLSAISVQVKEASTDLFKSIARRQIAPVSLVAILGFAGVSWLTTSAIAPQSAQAYTARADISLIRQPNESFESFLRRAEAVARAATQRSFDTDILVTDVSVTVLGQSDGDVAPVLVLEVSRQAWRSRPDPQRWATYLPNTRLLLGFEQPGAQPETQPGAPEAVPVPGTPGTPPVPGTPGIPPVPGTPGTPPVPGTPGIPAVPGTPGIPAVPPAPTIINLPPGAPNQNQAPPAAPGNTPQPNVPAAPGNTPQPNVPGNTPQPNVPAVPGNTPQPNVPAVPGNTPQPNVPAVPGNTPQPNVPAVPGNTPQPNVPAAPGNTPQPNAPAAPGNTSQPATPASAPGTTTTPPNR